MSLGALEDGPAGVNLRSFDNHHCQIVLLLGAIGKRNRGLIQSGDDFPWLLFFRSANGLFQSLGAEQFSLRISPLKKAIGRQH